MATISKENYFNEALSLIKEEDFRMLEKIGNEMMCAYPDYFYSYAFFAMGNIGFDLLSGQPVPNYYINRNDIELDMKGRIYFLARKKYELASKKTREPLENYYPSDIDYETGHQRRMHSNYDKKIHALLIIYNRGRDKKDFLIKKMNQLAQSDNEKKFLNNYILYWDNIDASYKEMGRYHVEAKEFAKNDYEKTPTPGNTKGFIVCLLMCLLSVSCAAMSVLEIITMIQNDFKILTFFGSIAAITVALTLLVLAIIYVSFSQKLNRGSHNVAKGVIIFSTIAVASAGISTCYVSLIQKTSCVGGFWFFVIGVLVGIALGVYSAIYIVKDFPHNTYKAKSLIGDWESLSRNRFSVDFDFDFAEPKVTKFTKINLSKK